VFGVAGDAVESDSDDITEEALDSGLLGGNWMSDVSESELSSLSEELVS
jgi:hypothetical protein